MISFSFPEKKYWFPNWVNYITWSLIVISCTISASFVVFYSLEWGKVKSEEWLSSLLLSVCQSIVIIQPVKVILSSSGLKRFCVGLCIANLLFSEIYSSCNTYLEIVYLNFLLFFSGLRSRRPTVLHHEKGRRGG